MCDGLLFIDTIVNGVIVWVVQKGRLPVATEQNFEVIVPLPEGFTAELAAQAFTAYLMGQNMYDTGQFDSKYPFQNPPFYIKVSDKWQLDAGNNVWLRDNNDKEERTVRITSRYNSHRYVAILEAAVTLFRAANYMPPA